MSCIGMARPDEKGVRIVHISMDRLKLVDLLADFAEKEGLTEVAESIRGQCNWVNIANTRIGLSFSMVCDPAIDKELVRNTTSDEGGK